MEFIFQQEGNLGAFLLVLLLLLGLLYFLLPIFIWRIWYWSYQSNRHLTELNIKLELLIREIAPDALPAVEVAEEPGGEPLAEPSSADDIAAAAAFASATAEAEQDDFFSDEDDIDFSMSDDIEDDGEASVDTELPDVGDEAPGGEEESAEDAAVGEAPGEEPTEDDEPEDELVMDFEDEPDEGSFGDQEEDIFTEEDKDEEEQSGGEVDGDDFSFTGTPPTSSAGIDVSEDASSDFTVEHFESNEEKSFEFEDVDDKSLEGPDDTFDDEDFAAPQAAEPGSAPSGWDESSTDDIWGESSASADADTASAPGADSDDLSFDGDVGSAFDEPKNKESVGDVADSFLSDLEEKLNLDSLAGKQADVPADPPRPAPSAPEPPPAEEKPAESHATLFARCEGCGHKLAYKQSLSGKRVRCPACRTAFALP